MGDREEQGGGAIPWNGAPYLKINPSNSHIVQIPILRGTQTMYIRISSPPLALHPNDNP
jgi:hypothetical protein